VLTFENIAVKVWGEEYIDITPKTVHNLMSRLRQKLRVAPDAPDYIASVRAVGYKFNANAVGV
jgi:DNA-binding response OmpR family regulator